MFENNTRDEQIAHLQMLHEQSNHSQIVSLIEAIDGYDSDYQLLSLLARAYNNLEDHEKAISLLKPLEEQGKNDPLWYYRLGYAYYYQSSDYDRRIMGLEMVEKAFQMGDELSFSFIVLAKRTLNLPLSLEQEAYYQNTVNDFKTYTPQTTDETLQEDALTAKKPDMVSETIYQAETVEKASNSELPFSRNSAKGSTSVKKSSKNNGSKLDASVRPEKIIQ